MRSHSDDSHTHTHLFDLIPRPSNLKVCTDMLQDMKGYTYKENDARDLKYSVRSFFVDCLWYGLPQSRRRIYIVGVKHRARGLQMNPEQFLDQVHVHLGKLHLVPPDPDC